MMLTVNSLTIGGTSVATKGLQLAYCIKPTRQSWDFNEGADVKYTNIGIDTIKFSVLKTAITAGHPLYQKVVGNEIADLLVASTAQSIKSTFVISDIAIKNGYVVFTLRHKTGATITEANI